MTNQSKVSPLRASNLIKKQLNLPLNLQD